MTLIFSGNDYKYELEGVMKLFIPATLFTHVFSDSIDTEDDYVFSQKKDNADNVCLSVKVRYDGKTCEKRSLCILKATWNFHCQDFFLRQ